MFIFFACPKKTNQKKGHPAELLTLSVQKLENLTKEVRIRLTDASTFVDFLRFCPFTAHLLIGRESARIQEI